MPHTELQRRGLEPQDRQGHVKRASQLSPRLGCGWLDFRFGFSLALGRRGLEKHVRWMGWDGWDGGKSGFKGHPVACQLPPLLFVASTAQENKLEEKGLF